VVLRTESFARPKRGASAARVEALEVRRLMAAGTTELRVEVGGGGSSYIDGAGALWAADHGFSGGEASAIEFPVAGTADKRLYYTFRRNEFTYALPATNGDYTLRLLFADPIYTTAGKRKFHVAAEGARVLSDFDVAGNGGGKAAIARSFDVTIADGSLNLAFAKGSVGNPIVSGIELLPAGPAEPEPEPAEPPAAPADLTATVAAGPSVQLRWTDASDDETKFRIERAVGAGAPFADYAEVVRDATSFTDTAVPAGATYVYRVSAVNAAGSSDPSDTASAMVAASPNPGPGPTPGPGLTWTTSTAAPAARVEPAGIQVGNKLYVWGGFTGRVSYEVQTRFDVFDLASQTWSTRKASPAPQTHAALATDGRYIYAAGGQYGGGIPGKPSKDVWRYDTTSDTWSSSVIPDLPESRYGGAMGLIDNRLYFFAGDKADRTTVSHKMWSLNLANPQAGWSGRRSLPNGLSGDHIASAVVDGKLYAVGGEHGHAATEDDDAPYIQHKYLLEYNPATDAWTRKADLIAALSHAEASTLVVNGKIVVLGGQVDDEKTTAAVRVYDPAANRWSSLTSLPERRKGGAAGYLNGKLIFTGGQRDGDWHVSKTTWAGTLTGL
jgi:N-acetylneuraminic acid mutarotase